MNPADQMFEELSKAAINKAMATLTKNGSIGLTPEEELMIQLGVACGIEVVMTNFKNVIMASRNQPDYFAE